MTGVSLERLSKIAHMRRLTTQSASLDRRNHSFQAYAGKAEGITSRNEGRCVTPLVLR
jgi:hypothetical protein